MKILFKFLHNNFKKYSIFFVYLLLINIISCKLKAQDTSRCAAINVIANELFQNKTKFVIAALPNKFILDTLYLSNHNYYKNLNLRR